MAPIIKRPKADPRARYPGEAADSRKPPAAEVLPLSREPTSSPRLSAFDSRGLLLQQTLKNAGGNSVVPLLPAHFSHPLSPAAPSSSALQCLGLSSAASELPIAGCGLPVLLGGFAALWHPWRPAAAQHPQSLAITQKCKHK